MLISSMRVPPLEELEMGLKHYVNSRAVSALLKKVRVKTVVERKPALVERLTKNPQLLGTAFDYLFRFELQRRFPHCNPGTWVAEDVLREECCRVPNGIDPFDGQALGNLIKQAALTRSNAKERLAMYLQQSTPTREYTLKIAESAILLAQLDVIARSNQLPEQFGIGDRSDIEELSSLLEVVPATVYQLCSESELLFLNPVFGQASVSIGGADADLIVGSTLIDFKTHADVKIDQSTHHQLLGYFLLARRHRIEKLEFPSIDRVGIYFSRHGYLWTMPTSRWTDQEGFGEVEQQFFELADQWIAG